MRAHRPSLAAHTAQIATQGKEGESGAAATKRKWSERQPAGRSRSVRVIAVISGIYRVFGAVETTSNPAHEHA